MPTIRIEVEGGCVTNVSGLPDGWDYELIDYDEPDEEPPTMEEATIAFVRRDAGSCEFCPAEGGGCNVCR